MKPVIGIMSRAFCGTTIVMRCLSSFPGTVALGETNWLALGKARRHCGSCIRNCPVFTQGVLGAEYNCENVFPKLMKRFPGDLYVSSDKGVRYFKKTVPLYALRGVVLVRDPRAIVRSDIERSKRFPTVEQSMIYTEKIFGDLLGDLGEVANDVVYITLEAFLRRPQEHLEEIGAAFRLDTPSEFHLPVIHALMGNNSAYKAKSLDPERADRWRDSLDHNLCQHIRESRLMEMYSELDKKSIMPRGVEK